MTNVVINQIDVSHDESTVTFAIRSDRNETSVDILKDTVIVHTGLTDDSGVIRYTEPRAIRDSAMQITHQFRLQVQSDSSTRSENATSAEYPAYVRTQLPLSVMKYHPVTESTGQLHLHSTDSSLINELKVEFNNSVLGVARKEGDKFVVAIDKARLDIADAFTIRVSDVAPSATRRFNPSETIIVNTANLTGYQKPVLADTLVIAELTHEIQNETDVVVRVKTNSPTTSVQLFINHVMVKTANTDGEGRINAIIPRKATGSQSAPVTNLVYVRETDKPTTRSSTQTFSYNSRVLPPIPPAVTPPPSAGGTAIKRFLFEEDTTGRNKNNLITGEFHTITPQNRTPQNVLIPGYAPYFRASLLVIDRATGLPLQENIDYTCEWPVMAAFDKTEGLTPLYGGIQFIDNEIVGQFELRYQTIGGQWALDGVAVAQALANQANDPQTTTFDQVLGRPIKLPPLEHVHSIDDFVGFGAVENAIDRLTETIRLAMREDRDAHPGYETLIDEYFRVLEELKAIRTQLNNTAAEINDSLIVQLNALKAQLEALRRDVNNTLQLKIDEINQALESMRAQFNATRDNLLAEIERAKRELTQTVNETKNNLTQSVNQAKSDLEAKFQQLKTRLEGLVNDFNAELRELINQAKRELNASIAQVKSDLSSLEQRLTAEDSRLAGLIQAITNRLAGDEFVKTAGEQNITGIKTFVAPVKFKQTNGQDTVSIEVKPAQFEMNYAGRLIRFLKDGSRVYFGSKEFVFAEDLTPLRQEINQAKEDLTRSIDQKGQQIQAVEARLAGDEFVKTAGNQTIGGKKTFTAGIEVGSASYRATISGTTNNVSITVPGVGSSNTHALRLQQDGKLFWSNRQVLDSQDKTELVQKDTELTQSIQGVRNDLTALQQKVNGLDSRYVLKAGDTMTGQLIVPSIKIGGNGGFVISKVDNLPKGMGPGLKIHANIQAYDIYAGVEDE